jgi:hypothetical protein
MDAMAQPIGSCGLCNSAIRAVTLTISAGIETPGGERAKDEPLQSDFQQRSVPRPDFGISLDQVTTRSATMSVPLVSGLSSSAMTKLAAPTAVPTIIGMARPSCQLVAK